jgi:PAS domain S-box-containing protein
MRYELSPATVEIMRSFLRDTADVVALLDDRGVFHAILAGDDYAGERDLVGKQVSELVSAEIAERVLAPLRNTTADGPAIALEIPFTYRSGVTRHIRARIVRLKDGSVLVHGRDVTDVRRAEAELRLSHERLAVLAGATTSAMYDCDVSSGRVSWKPQVPFAFGYAEEETRPASWWTECIHPQERERIQRSARDAITEPQRDVWTAAYRFRAADGSYRDVVDRARLLRDKDGVVTRVIGALLDVTEQKKTAEKLERAERVLAAGTLAAGFAHEVASPVNYASAKCALAVEALLDEKEDANARVSRALALLKDAELGTVRARSIIAELGGMLRRDSADGAVDLAAVIKDSVAMIGADVRGSANLVVSVDVAGALSVRGSRHRLGQVVTNLLTNALQAVRGRASPIVTVSLKQDGDVALLEVVDNGPGMLDHHKEHAFEPFFTTRTNDGGTGLGLAVAQTLIAAHHGSIEIVARDLGGTTLRVTLPLLHPECAERVRELTLGKRRGLRVLFVDDDEMTRALCGQILSDCEVVTLGSAEAAFSALSEATFDVVLSDVAMPGAGGDELFLRVRSLGAASFGFVTGDPVSARPGVPCLQKPFSPDELRRFVDGLNDARSVES